jgi:hypothetical protein
MPTLVSDVHAQRCSWTLAHGQAHHTVHQLTGELNSFVVWSRLGHAERVTATGELAGCQAAVVVAHAAVDAGMSSQLLVTSAD